MSTDVFSADADGTIRGVLEKSYGGVKHNGLISWWPPPLVVRTSCPIDVLYFPFDQQSCYLQFSSWAYNSKEVLAFSLCTEKLLE